MLMQIGTILSPISHARIALLENGTYAVTQATVDALQRQINEHLLPIWNRSASLRIIGHRSDLVDGEICAEILDTTDYPGLNGYHLCEQGGQPSIRVFARTAVEHDMDPTMVISHEIIETLVNPLANAYVLRQLGSGKGLLYAMEACDPVQRTCYYIDGVSVSDFVTPTYFLAGGRGPFDYMGALSAPFSPASDGNQRLVWVNGLPTFGI